MTQTQTFIAHMVTLLLVVAAAIVLAVKGIIDGATAIALIVAVTGVSLGAVVSSGGANTATQAQAASAVAPVAPPVAVVAPAAIPAAVVAPAVAAPPVGP